MTDLLHTGTARAWTATVDGLFGIATRTIEAQRATALHLLEANRTVVDLTATAFRFGLDRAVAAIPAPRTAAVDVPPVVETTAPTETTATIETAAQPETAAPTETAPAAKTPAKQAKPRARRTTTPTS